MKFFEIIVLGAGEAGKTTLVTNFLADKGEDEFTSSDPNFLSRDIEVDGVKYTVQVTDASKCTECLPTMDNKISTAHGLIILYSITNRDSFMEVHHFINHLWRLKGEQQFPLVIVGNKLDLEAQRVVLDDEGYFLAQKWGCAFLEASVLEEADVRKIFVESVREVLRKEQHKAVVEQSHKQESKKNCCFVL